MTLSVRHIIISDLGADESEAQPTHFTDPLAIIIDMANMNEPNGIQNAQIKIKFTDQGLSVMVLDENKIHKDKRVGLMEVPQLTWKED